MNNFCLSFIFNFFKCKLTFWFNIYHMLWNQYFINWPGANPRLFDVYNRYCFCFSPSNFATSLCYQHSSLKAKIIGKHKKKIHRIDSSWRNFYHSIRNFCCGHVVHWVWSILGFTSVKGQRKWRSQDRRPFLLIKNSFI